MARKMAPNTKAGLGFLAGVVAIFSIARFAFENVFTPMLGVTGLDVTIVDD